MKLRVRSAGYPDFEAELEPCATVAGAKIAFTAGCEIDPAEMRAIHKGKVLKDDQTLQDCGIDGTMPIVICRSAPKAAATGSCSSNSSGAGLDEGGCAPFQVFVRGPGGADFVMNKLNPNEPIEGVCGLAAEKCGLAKSEVLLMHKGRMLRDQAPGTTLISCGVASGDTLHLVRSAAQHAESSCPPELASGSSVVVDSMSGSAMPNAWNGPSGVIQQMQLLDQLLGNDVLARGGVPAQALAAGPRTRRAIPQDDSQVRLDREIRAMGRAVRYLAAERNLRGPDGRPPSAEQIERHLDELPEDPELLNEIARVMAENRSRGAPVPRADMFVDRLISRGQEARALHSRLEREREGGLEPELEEALAAADREANPNITMWRLGGEPRDPRAPPPQ